MLTLPEGTKVIDPKGGVVEENTVRWIIGELEEGAIGIQKVIIKMPKIDSLEDGIELKADLFINSKLVDSSLLHITVFSNRFGNGEHRRYIQGVPGGEFKPDNYITRAEIAVAFSRILKLEDFVKGEVLYSDCNPDSWYARGVEASTKKGLFQGTGDGNFRPDQAITRAELVAVIARFLGLSDNSLIQQSFKDTEGNWAENYISELYRNNVITGYTDGTFKPAAYIRRSEAVTMINRMLNRGPLRGVEPTYPDIDKDHWAFGDIEECSRRHEYYRNVDGSETATKTIEEDLYF